MILTLLALAIGCLLLYAVAASLPARVAWAPCDASARCVSVVDHTHRYGYTSGELFDCAREEGGPDTAELFIDLGCARAVAERIDAEEIQQARERQLVRSRVRIPGVA
ncbi:hypothetical protein DAETH_28590 [Deinococcus aetherius]|uniref:Uncharacterized protein n=1 Tax=Deinococcus aetherius TaxID=200252 RepID=A0ABN6RHS7_9DEIO|nr:hypothetical protein [Deinococcus aetherius]BDP42890.1 hypothetical protein DAETH_28590 [Deinococcus aetherius]